MRIVSKRMAVTFPISDFWGFHVIRKSSTFILYQIVPGHIIKTEKQAELCMRFYLQAHLWDGSKSRNGQFIPQIS